MTPPTVFTILGYTAGADGAFRGQKQRFDFT